MAMVLADLLGRSAGIRTSTLGIGSARRRPPADVVGAFFVLARWMASSIRVAKSALSCGVSIRMEPLADLAGEGGGVWPVAAREVAPQATNTASWWKSGRGRHGGAGMVLFMV